MANCEALRFLMVIGIMSLKALVQDSVRFDVVMGMINRPQESEGQEGH
ncbi:MAG: hypothetical protein PVJ36_00110 [Nitrospirota bacterium]